MDGFQALSLFAEWLTILLRAAPAKLRPTFLELLLGCIIARSGHITNALLAITPRRTWTAYYKAIEKGVFSWLALAKQWTQLLCNVLLPEEILLAIDDTLSFRSSKKAPSTALHHDHANRPNRPKYVWGQLFVCVAMVCSFKGRQGAFPLLLRMIPSTGNRSKLKAAILLTRILVRWLGHRVPIRLLLDAWYMKGPLVKDALRLGLNVIGQVRSDTVLYLSPERVMNPKRGRPRKYGLRLSLEKVQALFDEQSSTINAYGEDRLFQYYCFAAHVRFLNGRVCHLVWCRFQKRSGKWTNWHLLLSTDLSCCGELIIKRYASRWWVESCFNELKNQFGLKDTWQQTRQVVARWRQIVCLAYGLPRLMALVAGPQAGTALLLIPWRRKHPMTAGWIARALAKIFGNLAVRELWDRKSQKFQLPKDLLEGGFRKAA